MGKDGRIDNKQLKKKFKNKLAGENSRRFVIMLGFVAATQGLLLLFEAVGIMSLERETLIVRLSVIFICAVFSFLLTRVRKRAEKIKNVKLLVLLKSVLHFAVLGLGCYYTIYMFAQGYYTFSVFIITALIVSLTHIRFPYLFNGLLVVSFVGLSLYLQNSFDVPEYYLNEAHTMVMLLLIISVGNILIYRRHWDIFTKENKIKQINEKLVEISQLDELTGLYNRRKVLEELDNIIGSARRDNSVFCAVMMDLDNFKRVNDEYGHIEGDSVLKLFSQLVKSNLRKNDVFGRWGGEEFLIIIPESRKDDAFAFVDRIRKIVENHNFERVGKLTFSAGICEFVPEYTDDKLIGNADFALYISKQLGRNQVKVFSHTN